MVRNGTSGKLLGGIAAAFAVMLTMVLAIIDARQAPVESRIEAMQQQIDPKAGERMATMEEKIASLEKAFQIQSDLSRARDDRQDQAGVRQAVFNKEDQQRLDAIEREVWGSDGG